MEITNELTARIEVTDAGIECNLEILLDLSLL
jgi:hypothetical protein